VEKSFGEIEKRLPSTVGILLTNWMGAESWVTKVMMYRPRPS